MKVLTFTSLYPNSQQPRHGIFIENRLVNFKKKYPEVEVSVVAPVPWFPFAGEKFGRYGKYPLVDDVEIRQGVKVFHPRYPVIPKVGMSLAPMLMAMALLPFLKKLIKSGFDFDVIDSHFFYPDGVAAVWLAKQLSKPCTVTARGSDIHLYPSFTIPKMMIKWALRNADQPISVCQALADEMQKLEPTSSPISVCRNGVDLDKFSPLNDRETVRKALNLQGFTLLSVGNLIELKGHHLIINALQDLPEVQLIIAGDGPWRSKLKEQVKRLKLDERVRFVGLLTQDQLKEYYGASDLLVLASSREGWANVLLESMACGTPVLATSIWGTPEVVTSENAGRLLTTRTSKEISQMVKKLMLVSLNRKEVREYANKFSWDETSTSLYEVFNKVSQ